MDNENPNPTPDFGFIMNQPGGELPHASRRPSKLVVILGVAILLLIGALGLAFILGRAHTLAPQSNPSQAAIQTVTKYYDYLGQNDYKNAYNLIANSTVSESTFINKTAPLFAQNLKLTACKLGDTTQAGTTYYTTVQCPYITKTTNEVFLVYSTVTNGQAKITKITNPTRGLVGK